MTGIEKQADVGAGHRPREILQRPREALLVGVYAQKDLESERLQRVRHVLGVVARVEKPHLGSVFGIAYHQRDAFVRIGARAPGKKIDAKERYNMDCPCCHLRRPTGLAACRGSDWRIVQPDAFRSQCPPATTHRLRAAQTLTFSVPQST